MKTADLYICVSTDEQAEKGFSIKYQEDVLRRHCLINSIQVQNIFFEDFPVRNFNCPTWSSVLTSYKTNKANRPDYILFTKWNRFSRNIAEAYLMIKKLQDINVIPQAIEQPLDISIPENKMILAIYLVTPEVENDVRSLNVKEKMQKARAMGSVPIGYRNTQSAAGEKYIAIQEPEATLIRDEIKNAEQKPGIAGITEMPGLIQKPLYKITEVSGLFGITRGTVYKWIKAGKLRPVKIHRSVYFLWNDLEQLLHLKK